MRAKEQGAHTRRNAELHMFHDPDSGLRVIIAIDDLTLGPALGGCRALRYPSLEAARVDAVRLARGMTRKAAVARIPHGGGKSVILLPDHDHDRVALMRAFGDAVEKLHGMYITAEDSGTSLFDMEIVATRTSHVTGLSREVGGAGDPSPFTALGVLRGIEAVTRLTLERSSVEGVHVAIQGVGHVGYRLAELLLKRGARVTACDADPKRLERAADELGIHKVEPERIFDVTCDVFAPCALGGILDAGSVQRLTCRAVAGAANNQLLTARDGELLCARGILYAPDYVVNAGGLMAVASEVKGFDEALVETQVNGIYETVYELCERAMVERKGPEVLADDLAARRIAEAQSRLPRPIVASSARDIPTGVTQTDA